MPPKRPVRERLLDAADALFFVDGAIAAPVATILEAAQASPPSLYLHFGNKEGLVAAALRRRLEIWTAVWDDALGAASTPEQRALALWDALENYQNDHMTERWCAFSGTAAATRRPGPALQAVLDAETELLRTRLEAAAAELAACDADAQALASALLVSYTGTLALMLREPYPQAIAEGRAAAAAHIRSCAAAASAC